MSTKAIQNLPYNLEAEKCLLGAILIDSELQYEIVSRLNIEDFYLESHKLVFECIQTMLTDSKFVDIVTVSDEMSKTTQDRRKRTVNISTLAQEMEKKTTLEKVGGMAYLTELATSIPSTANYEYYLGIVKRDSTLRKLIRTSDEIRKFALSSSDEKQAVSIAEKLIYDVSEKLDTSSLINAKDSIKNVLTLFENIQTDKNFLQGLNTGFTCFDNATNGLHKGNLVIVAARPSVGKSTLVMNIVENVALRHNAVCAVFSLEMTKEEIVERMLYTLSGVSSTKARKGKLDANDWKKLWDAQKLIEKTEIMIDDTAMTTAPMILSKCRRLKALKGRLDLIVVDHMQLMNAVKTSENRQAEMSEISRNLKMIAKELNVPVVALSQLRRLPNGQKPVLSDLRESGSIEQDADVVLFIHRPNFANSEEAKDESGIEIRKDECLLIIAKNRSGPLANFKLAFNGELSKFVNIAPELYGEPYTYQPKKSISTIDDADVPYEEEDTSPPDDGSIDEVFDD